MFITKSFNRPSVSITIETKSSLALVQISGHRDIPTDSELSIALSWVYSKGFELSNKKPYTKTLDKNTTSFYYGIRSITL